MKITKRQLRRIIREEKRRLIAEQMEMDPKTASAIQMLQTIHTLSEQQVSVFSQDQVVQVFWGS